MANEPSVITQNISKKFCKDLRRSMAYGIYDIGRDMFGLPANSGNLRKDEFWALDDVSFELKKGETLGIIGPNGSGKSTLLKLLNGIFRPDKGSIEINGRIGALIEVGAGFHPMLTGRENIYVNGAILGMSKKEIDKKFDAIVDFSGIGDFLDSPVKYYSSGMYVRLGFAIAIHAEPDILLIDEVLAVGDIKFQNKSYERILKIKDNCSIIIVSHSLLSLSRMCDAALWLDKGKSRKYGQAQEVIREYSNVSLRESSGGGNVNVTDRSITATGDLYMEKVRLYDGYGNEKDVFNYNDDLVVQCNYVAAKELGKISFRITISLPTAGVIFGACMLLDGINRDHIFAGTGTVVCRFNKIPLAEGTYQLNINVVPEMMIGKIYRHIAIKSFDVRSEPVSKEVYFHEYTRGIITVPHTWEYKNDDKKTGSSQKQER